MRDLEGKTIFITGAARGMGNYMAYVLAARGAALLLHGRNRESIEKAFSSIKDETGNGNINMYTADFASLQEVKHMADTIVGAETRLDVLINNAGIGFGAPNALRQTGREGYELRFTVNYLAPYLLTRSLIPLLKYSAPSRVVNVASAGQEAIDFEDIMTERNYTGIMAYRRSKLAMIMMTLDFAGELDKSGITVNAIHPATFMDTFMVRESGIEPLSSIKSGAEPTISLATDPEFQGITGRYFDHMKEQKANSQAYDPAVRKKLRELTEELISRVLPS